MKPLLPNEKLGSDFRGRRAGLSLPRFGQPANATEVSLREKRQRRLITDGIDMRPLSLRPLRAAETVLLGPHSAEMPLRCLRQTAH
jgi:hypothetical protein